MRDFDDFPLYDLVMMHDGKVEGLLCVERLSIIPAAHRLVWFCNAAFWDKHGSNNHNTKLFNLLSWAFQKLNLLLNVNDSTMRLCYSVFMFSTYRTCHIIIIYINNGSPTNTS